MNLSALSIASARQRLCWVLLFAALAFAFCVRPAFAQATGSYGDFHCENGAASGSMYDTGNSCPATISTDKIFSFLVCNMEKLSSNIMGGMYCGIVNNLTPAVEAVLTLAIVFFGIGFTTGFIHATAREFQVFLLKMGLIWVFATQADYMIGVGYNFLVTGAREGIAVALSGIFPGGQSATGADVYGYLDRFLGKALEYASAMVGVNWDDQNGLATCQNAVFNVIAIMAIAFPPLFYVSIAIIFKICMTFLRAVFGYIYAIMGITFLMTLSPIFLCFGLFRQTKPFFDKFLAYLASFTLQMVIVFAFLAFVVSIPVQNITGSITGIIVPNKEIRETTAFRFPWQYCTLCKFEMVDKDGNVVPEDSKTSSATLINGGKLQCKTPQETINVFDTTSPNTGKAPDKELQNELIKFAATGLLSLFILAYVVDTVLRYAPSIAQALAGGMGATYAPQLGGGFSPRGIATTNMPGSKFIDTFEHGFSDGYMDAMQKGTFGTPGAVVAGFKEASQRMLFGGRVQTTDAQGRPIGRPLSGAASQNDPGMVDSFLAFFVNPNPDVPDQ